MFFASLVLALTSIMIFSACQHGNGPETEPKGEVAVPGTRYICPMNCEHGKTYAHPGQCPVCNMTLEPVKADEAGEQVEYFTEFKTDPAQLAAGKPGLLSFTPKIRGNENAPVPLDLVHEKKMHLILVSDDLSRFDHVHPEFSEAGSYDIRVLGTGENFSNGRGHNETRFETGGKYWAFADYKPLGGLNRVDRIELNIAGPSVKPVAYSQQKLHADIDGYTVSLEGDHFSSGQQHIPVSIKKNGNAVDPAGFENYLGEKAHLVFIETASKAFVHTHPSAKDGHLEIHTTFPAPGTYRGWLQFQTDGQVHTADFVIRVAAGSAGAHDDHHMH